MWSQPPRQNPAPLVDPSKDIAVLGADIIAETFGELAKKSLMQMKSTAPPEEASRGNILNPEGGPPPPFQTPPPLMPPGQPHQEVAPPPSKLEWNPRMGVGVSPNRRGSAGQEYRPEMRPPGDFQHHSQSPFSWQRSAYARERRPSYEEFRQDFPQQNPYVYRRPDNEQPPGSILQRDPRLPPGDPRSAAAAAAAAQTRPEMGGVPHPPELGGPHMGSRPDIMGNHCNNNFLPVIGPPKMELNFTGTEVLP